MNHVNNVTDLAGRILLATIFLLAGIDKIAGYEATAGYMASMGVPGALLPLVIALEIGGALALIAGLQVRIVAWALAGFCVVSAVIFHSGDDPMQGILFMKNLAMAGGFLILARNGAGAWSLDARRQPQTA